MKTAEIVSRIERLEKKAGSWIETEDIREAEIVVYGSLAIAEIEEREGREALEEMLLSPELSEEIKGQIADSRRKYTTQEDFTHEKYQKGSF